MIQYKAQFIRFDLDMSGDIDEMELKQMLEKWVHSVYYYYYYLTCSYTIWDFTFGGSTVTLFNTRLPRLDQAKTHKEIKKMIAQV